MRRLRCSFDKSIKVLILWAPNILSNSWRSFGSEGNIQKNSCNGKTLRIYFDGNKCSQSANFTFLSCIFSILAQKCFLIRSYEFRNHTFGTAGKLNKSKQTKTFKTNQEDLWVTPECDASLMLAFSIMRKETKIKKNLNEWTKYFM